MVPRSAPSTFRRSSGSVLLDRTLSHQSTPPSGWSWVIVKPSSYNTRYLKTKKERMAHKL